MNMSVSPSLAGSMASAVTSSANGSKDSACAPKMAGPAQTPSPKATSVSDRADIPERIFGHGTLKEQPPSSTECVIHGLLSVRQSGNIGQEILDQDGKIIAWTTDAWIAQAICKLLNDNEGMIPRLQERNEHETLCC